MKRRLLKSICLFMTVVMLAGCCTTVSFGASKKVKMTTYFDCVVQGDYAYCRADNSIWKVNLIDGTSENLVQHSEKTSICGMKLKNGYLYYSYLTIGTYNEYYGLYRIKPNGESKKRLVKVKCNDGLFAFAIKGKKIYYSWNIGSDFRGKVQKRKMNLNGSRKAKTKTKVINKEKRSNKDGYKVYTKFITDDEDENAPTIYEYYLKTPDKRILFNSEEHEY